MGRSKLVLAALALIVAVGASIANVQSIIDARYGGPMKDIALAQKHVNRLRTQLEGVSTEEFVAARRTLQVFIEKEMAGQLALVRNAFDRINEPGVVFLKALNKQQAAELLVTMQFYDEEAAGLFYAKGAIDNAVFIGTLADCADAIESRGFNFLKVVSEDVPEPGMVQIERANLVLEMARFDILVSYFVILNENLS